MKRQKIRYGDEFNGSMEYRRFADDDNSTDIPLQQKIIGRPKYRSTLEAQIQPGDTLQAIAIRYNCSLADLKTINKIERESEIHARKTLKVPLTPDTVLVQHLPIVHKSGQNSPKHTDDSSKIGSPTLAAASSAALPTTYLNEKLMVAAVSLSPNASTSSRPSKVSRSISGLEPSINDIILNTEITRNEYNDEDAEEDDESAEINLLGGGSGAAAGGRKNVYYETPEPRLITGANRYADFPCPISDAVVRKVFWLVAVAVCVILIFLIYKSAKVEIHHPLAHLNATHSSVEQHHIATEHH